MKKYTIQEAAQLLANKTHAIRADNEKEEVLISILKLAFPDYGNTNYNFKQNYLYGCSYYNGNGWTDNADHLQLLEVINLSDVIEEWSVHTEAETITISKSDYDRLLKQTKGQDQKFLDNCAIAAMNSIASSYITSDINGYTLRKLSEMSYLIADNMLKTRNK